MRELAFELPSRAKACNGRPPAKAYPELLSAPRPYLLEQELALFDMKRIDAYLALFQWRRKVSKNGTIQLGGRRCKYSVGGNMPINMCVLTSSRMTDISFFS